jgi:hypothetical protein
MVRESRHGRISSHQPIGAMMQDWQGIVQRRRIELLPVAPTVIGMLHRSVCGWSVAGPCEKKAASTGHGWSS